jgi:hypothetical protein
MMVKTLGKSCCSCGCDDCEKKVLVEYLYLDLQTCERCIGADRVLDEVMLVLTPALKLAGFTVEYKKIEMKTVDMAIKHQFVSSPTIRVNGQDICKSVVENNCGCCSEISNTDVECRVFEYSGKTYEIPPKEMLAEGILQLVFSQYKAGCSPDKYELPENLKNFFDGTKTKSRCHYGGNCC